MRPGPSPHFETPPSPTTVAKVLLTYDVVVSKHNRARPSIVRNRIKSDLQVAVATP